jgi:hypothetical protein
MGGYPGQLQWYSDSFAYTVIALRHGACVIPETLALLRASPESYSQRGMDDPARQRPVLVALLELLATPAYHDIRRMFRAAPSNLSHYGPLMPRLQCRRIRDWDLLRAGLGWRIDYAKRLHRVGWVALTAKLTLHLIRRGLRSLRRGLMSRSRQSGRVPGRRST